MDEHITTGQAIIMLVGTRLVLAISTMPTINLPPHNQDTWFMNLVSIIYTLIIFIPLLFLANRFNNFNITGYLRILYGKTLGGIIIVLYGLFFLMNAVNSLTILGELTVANFLEQESSMNIIIFIIVVVFFIISRGIIAVMRGFQVLAPIAIFITVSLVLLGISNVDFSLLRPVLSDSSFWDINRGAFLLSLYFTDIFLLLMIVPRLKNKKSINKITIISVTVAIVALAGIVIITQGTLGIEQTRHSNASFLLYVRLINAFDLLERIDSIFMVGWIIISIGRITGFAYLATQIYRDLFNKREDDRLILIITLLALLIVSVSITNQRSVIGIRREFDLYYGILFIIFTIIIPIISCIVYFFRRKTLRYREPSHNLVDKLE